MKPIPTPADLQKYNVNLPNQVEGIRQSLYDSYNTANKAGTSTGNQINFFQVPIGQGVASNGTGPKTLEDTNMQSAGQLPTPKLFLVESVHVHFLPNIAYSTTAQGAESYVNEVQSFVENGYLEFFIGSKPYLDEAPLGRFPPNTYTYGFSALAMQGTGNTAAVTTAMAVSYAVASGKPYTMEPPIVLIPNQNFVVSLNWPNAARTFTAGFRIFVILAGILYRNSQ
jgi:hypothetical protein